MSKDKALRDQLRQQRDHEHAQVRIKMEVIEVYEDIIDVTPFGESSIGTQVDHIIAHHAKQGSRLGNITIDLREYSDAFIPPEIHQSESLGSG